jgi:F0F1-type ATP synthase assembly protein I
MGKTTTRKNARKSKVETDPTQDYFDAFNAKQRFIGSVLNMGWRMAVTFIIPVIIGTWLDRRFDTSPSYTIAGIFVAVAGSVMVVWNTVKEVNAETAEMEKKSRKRKPKHV